MVQENEVILLLLGLGVLIFALANRERLEELPAVRLLAAGLYLLLAAWVLTILEGFFWPRALNLLEHGCYAASAALQAAWCRQVFCKTERHP